jgi:hypothetical protein
MITHTMPLPDINKGFELMHEGKSIRSVVVYWASMDQALNAARKGLQRRKGTGDSTSGGWRWRKKPRR